MASETQRIMDCIQDLAQSDVDLATGRYPPTYPTYDRMVGHVRDLWREIKTRVQALEGGYVPFIEPRTTEQAMTPVELRDSLEGGPPYGVTRDDPPRRKSTGSKLLDQIGREQDEERARSGLPPFPDPPPKLDDTRDLTNALREAVLACTSMAVTLETTMAELREVALSQRSPEQQAPDASRDHRVPPRLYHAHDPRGAGLLDGGGITIHGDSGGREP